MERPNIALVHDFLVKLGGAERVLKHFSDMFPHAPIFTLLYDEKAVGSVFPKDKVVPSRLQRLPKIIRRKQRYLLPLMPRAVESFDLSKFDLVISSSNAFAHGVVTDSHTSHITYFHSPMRYAWDWYHEYKQEQGVGKFRKAAMAKLLHGIRQWDAAASSRTDMAIANSQTVRKRIQKYYRRDAEVVYPPVQVHRFPERPSTDHEDYFLIVSALTPFKRIDLAIQLFNRIQKRLVIIGTGSQRKFLESISGKTIEFLGHQSDEAVEEYMKHCRALLFPGEDDFGITPVEAMACGKPVLALERGGATETVIPGVTGEFFPLPTVEAMEGGLARLLQNEAQYHPITIRRHSEQFDTSVFLKKMKRVVKNALKDA